MQCHVFFFAGKTYVGLKIAKALLKNHRVWSANSPMLVVCYTNHALDQFLEGTMIFDISKLCIRSHYVIVSFIK